MRLLKVQKNSLAVLTTREPNAASDESRFVFAVFLVDESYEGDNRDAGYIAKNIVSAGLADRCTVTLAYAIGKAEPVAANVDTDGTGEYRDEVLEQAVRAVFDLTPAGMRHTLGLDKPIFAQFCNYGHFTHPDAPWEQTEKAEVLCNACRIKEAGVSDR